MDGILEIFVDFALNLSTQIWTLSFSCPLLARRPAVNLVSINELQIEHRTKPGAGVM
jgi:hypothetical protein